MAQIHLTNGRILELRQPHSALRPTSVKARKALFDMLTHRLQIDFAKRNIMDIFAGAGSLAFEALTRGAQKALFIDKDRSALAQIMMNAEKLGFADLCAVLCRDGRRLGAKPRHIAPSDLVFADPPYQSHLVLPMLKSLRQGGWLSPFNLIIIEEEQGTAFNDYEKTGDWHLRARHHIQRARFDVLATMS